MPKKKYAHKSKETKKVARQRIERLFLLADQNAVKRPDLSKRYTLLARTIGMKAKVRIPPGLKKRYCKHCYTYFLPGKSARFRIRNGVLTIFCHFCKNFSRYPLAKPKNKKAPDTCQNRPDDTSCPKRLNTKKTYPHQG